MESAGTLRISYDAEEDLLLGVLPGVAIDGHPSDAVSEVLDGLWIFHGEAGGAVIGFCAVDAFAWDVMGNDDPVVWGKDGLRWDVPTLGLTIAPIGAIVLAAQRTLDGSTPDMVLFALAVSTGQDGDRAGAERLWRLCLAAGDMRAHFGLGYTLVDLGRPHEAFGHLVTYTELAPALSWAWLWRGRAAEDMGELDEARACFRRAIEAEEAGSDETDAADRLSALERAGR